MTAVADTTPPVGGDVPISPHLDLTLIQTAPDHARIPDDDSHTEAELIDRIASLESLQNSLVALQAAHVRAFGRAHVAARTESGVVEPEKLERSIAAQVLPSKLYLHLHDLDHRAAGQRAAGLRAGVPAGLDGSLRAGAIHVRTA